jgi:hypothetical protein
LVQISFLGNDRKRGVQPPHRSCQRFDRGEPIKWPDAHFWLSLPVCPFSCARRKQTKPKSAWGADDPTRAAFPFSLRLILSESGHEVRIFLLAEAASLMRKAAANAILPVGWPPLSEALEKLVARHV